MQINGKRRKPHENHDFDTPAGGVKRIARKRCKSIEIDVSLTQIIVSGTPAGGIKRIARDGCKSIGIEGNITKTLFLIPPSGVSNGSLETDANQ